jgi:NAD+ diphosphatase
VGRVPVGEARVLLGVEDDGVPVFAREPLPGEPLEDLRGAVATLAPAEAGLYAYAQSLLHWHRTHGFCPRCGRPAELREAGFSRACPEGHVIHPRTDPVAIMLVVDDAGDRVVLGRQPAWPAGRYSSLAGFVEPGETLEAAVAREVAEEAGVRVGAVRYVTSQPWPFPASLMLGCLAAWAGGEVRPDRAELEDARWFGREEVAAAALDDEPWSDRPGDAERLLLPPRSAIARTLIDTWLAG